VREAEQDLIRRGFSLASMGANSVARLGDPVRHAAGPSLRVGATISPSLYGRPSPEVGSM